MIEVLTNFFNEIYDAGIFPQEWLKSTFVTLPKINNAKQCQNYRTISLMSHILKIFLRIIYNRLYKKCEQNIKKTQFGFRNGLGTRDALFTFQVLIQRTRDMNNDVYVCFLDYEKAFDRVQHNKLLDILNNMGLDTKDVRIIQNLYWKQTATVRVEDDTTEEVQILRGVRQGCILSPVLFNLYAEAIFDEALENKTEGIIINGVTVNNIRYADDAVLLTNSLEDMQRLVDCVNDASNSYGLNINKKKTKYMVISPRDIEGTALTINGELIQRVDKFKYLGCYFNKKWDHSMEIRCRIEQSRSPFFKMIKVLGNRNLKIEL